MTVSSVSEARRGELWLIDLGEPVGHEQGWRRPALVLSSDHWNGHAATLVVVPLTRTRQELPTRVEIAPEPANGLSEESYARVEDLRSIGQERLVRRLGTLDLVALTAIERVVRRFLEV